MIPNFGTLRRTVCLRAPATRRTGPAETVDPTSPAGHRLDQGLLLADMFREVEGLAKGLDLAELRFEPVQVLLFRAEDLLE